MSEKLVATVETLSESKLSRWGRPGLQQGDRVMKGPANFWHYTFSFKYQPAWMPGGNIPAPFMSGETFSVPSDSIQWPGGWEFFKGIYGQRIYLPPGE